MGDEEEEPKYKLFVKGQEAPLEKGSQQYTGQGNAFYLNGDTYNGTYVEGLRRGKGSYGWKKFGDSYEGQYEENRKHGFGKLTYRSNVGEEDEEPPDENAPPRGGTYLGYFHGGQRGCPEGATAGEVPSDGTFTYVNGDIYVGQWQVGKKHGRGSYTYAKDGTKLIGDWEKGKIVVGKWVFPNGTFYSGKFRYNKPHGEGVWVFPNGNQLTGEFVQKQQPGDDDGAPGGDEEDENAPPKPDPKVWCHFKYGSAAAVHGGSMLTSNSEA
mmetsp:Transcript_74076/g.240855  ORF Transcript_74076/g.240855 Transcript_74076/m.240855 type:complete len:268 (+) Transcript_74076:103-906(+)|eukprot:CAMPEP_0203967080 /NCGR_PEP_ID=MMETSP0359-20131031/96155_1 /ASSEMBLY_ACC=CAM_ASM_000338 /TAXON_ID=268821 /ORGANISM="Scrippsiella Hangoei, Strain SHTV-5" /LENGTH=267 /DNA_ID=CAMNT_0050904781 /DNA_START=94 /DNA_END=897 /DNA_ORIENTATION=-